MKALFITVTRPSGTAVGAGRDRLVADKDVNWYDRVHLCLRSGQRGVRNGHLFTGTLDEAIHAALARPTHERDRLMIKYEFSPRRLSWNRIVELAARPDFPMLI